MRGLRNNNPLNIMRGRNKWLGEVDSINGVHDGYFCQFQSMEYGYRAAIKTLLTYQREHKCKTIRQIISRWAPPTENNTKVYIARVVEDVNKAQPNAGITADTELDLKFDSVTLLNLLCSMMSVENGVKARERDYDAAKRAIRMVWYE